ncbi:hypothetical protein EKK58_04355 [Candidatus Dependentiae bacterium]|nr:MAG: hypothetical protein EKK58_04355 [Candidatus Dependentiae bacterium]
MTSKIIETPLSNIDLNELLKDINKTLGENKKINIFTVDEMIKSPKIFNDELKKNHYCIIFLKPKNTNIGHWVIMFKNDKNEIYFFDSYGNNPLNLSKKLYDFLLKYYPNTIYNSVQYQKYSSKVATCGRWCMFVISMLKIFKNLNVDKLNIVLKNMKNKYKMPYDNIISSLINFDIE